MAVDNLFEINYESRGTSVNTNEYGMREMQARVYEKRHSQYLLVKSPPASGKSRALMFTALHKLNEQGIKKVIIAVPETSIGKSFKNTQLKKHGYYWDWQVKDSNNLTKCGTDKSKVKQFVAFMKSDNPEDNVLLCTQATLRFAYAELDDSDFEDTLLAIDEFHHVSKDENSVLGNALRNIMKNSNAHIFAMTGSYFRGDSVPILDPADEQKFDRVTYTYYEQLEGYEYLKSFAMGYSFYTDKYTDALDEVIPEFINKKTIIHIPNVNSMESTKEKELEVDAIFDALGDWLEKDSNGINHIRTADGKILLVADLVRTEGREVVKDYLANMSKLEDLDMIIALGMAKRALTGLMRSMP
ncbi:MAG: DEAD/DEAH box helicase family protein [Turicibacter sp.]|nr:DEAD/DEAH box helicase family protein [Turicibacter sp.]